MLPELPLPSSNPDSATLKNELAGKRVLFISYNGMLDPLGQSQVLPYLRELAKDGLEFTVLSFERLLALRQAGADGVAQLRAELGAAGIDWHFLRYHQTPSLPATAYDVIAGTRLARRLVREKRIDLLHARSHIPATIALAVKRKLGLPLIFDLRGLMAEEYVDAEHWTKGSVPYRLTKSVEQRVLQSAEGIVTLTARIWPLIQEWPGLRGRSVAHEIIPCCTDLERFKFSPAARSERRRELGIEDAFVIVYSGSIDGWYLTERMADFFAHLRQKRKQSHFLWLSPSKHERIEKLMEERKIPPADFSIKAVPSGEVATYLAAADAGIAFIKPCFSKLASSPTKNAEYLACGLPLIINAGIGDSDALVTEERVGVMVDQFDVQAFDYALERLEVLTEDPENMRRRARATATRLFDVQTVGASRYRELYRRVLSEGKKRT